MHVPNDSTGADRDPGGGGAVRAGGGSLFFNCGGPITISLTHAAYITSDTTLDGGNAVTLTGNLSTQLFIVGNGFSLDLKNIILDKGYYTGSGGAILNTGSLTLDHVTIQNSIAGHYGGGIWASGPVTIRNDSLLYNNSAGKSGGGLYEQNPRAVVVDNSTFSSNSAQDVSTGVGALSRWRAARN